MSDIVTRLRDIRTTHGDAVEAADEIERLRAENDRLRQYTSVALDPREHTRVLDNLERAIEKLERAAPQPSKETP